MIFDKVQYTKELLQKELDSMLKTWSTTIFAIDDAADFIIRYKCVKVVINTIDELQEKGQEKELNMLVEKINDDMSTFIDELAKSFSW